MNKDDLIFDYELKKISIKKRLDDFKRLSEKEMFNEMIFCLLTPQSNAQKCWSAVEEINKIKKWNFEKISFILSKRTRFHNNKTRYVLKAKKSWKIIKGNLKNENRKDLRNFIEENVKGYGLKEAGHFLRNIGKSNNQIAILDRHILRNLKALNIVNEDKIKSKRHYLEIEKKFLNFSKEVKIPIDELDLLFWSKENGEVFK